MKQVFGGLVYNTETAEEIGNRSYSYESDFHHYDETLFKTKNGNFFLYGKGGPLSSWRKTVGQNEWVGDSGIRTLSREEALDWCEKAEIDADVIAEHFTVAEA